MNNKGSRYIKVGLLFGVLFGMLAFSASASELQIPTVEGKIGHLVTIPIKVDKIENLAGLKLVIEYDSKLLEYKAAEKSFYTSSLMHVVNDKKPGQLIIVMAGAKGIAGKDIILVNLTFLIKKNSGFKSEYKTDLMILEVEMMSDQLKHLECTKRINSLTVIP